MKSRSFGAVFALFVWSLLLASLSEVLAQDLCLNLGVPVWTNNQVQFTFSGESGVTYFIESSPDLQNWLPVATNSDAGITRVITLDAPTDSNFYRASRALLPMFVAGIVVKQGVNLKGNEIYMDAYDSADTNQFPNGLWNSTNAFAGGDVATAGGVLSVQNAAIHGRLLLGPVAAFALGAHGLVGDMPANWPAQSGVESPDWVVTNFWFCMPDVSLPYTTGLDPPAGTGTNSYVLDTGNYYVGGNLSASQNLQVNGSAILYVTGNFNVHTVTIAPGGSLSLYAGQATGSQVSAIFGNIYNSGNALNLQFFGLPTCKSLTLSGTNGYVGTVYAPEIDLAINNGSNVPYHFQGACAVNSFSAIGGVNIHFDQNLKRIGPMR